MVNRELFVKKLKQNKCTQKELAAYLGCSEVSLANKMNGKQFFTCPELELIWNKFDWTPAEFILTFICTDLQNSTMIIDIENIILKNNVK